MPMSWRHLNLISYCLSCHKNGLFQKKNYQTGGWGYTFLNFPLPFSGDFRWFVTLSLEFPEKTSFHSWKYILQNCMTPLRNSMIKNQNPWKFHMSFSFTSFLTDPWNFHMFFNTPCPQLLLSPLFVCFFLK